MNVASQTCLAASKRDDDALLKADAKCDAADPLQQWASDSATGLLALQPTPPAADFDERATLGLSTWGASVVEIPFAGGNESWHMWASVFLDGCGVTS